MYTDYENLVKCRGLNTRIELGGMKLTEKQLENLIEYINSEPIYRLFFKKIDTYNLTIVKDVFKSDLEIE